MAPLNHNAAPFVPSSSPGGLSYVSDEDSLEVSL